MQRLRIKKIIEYHDGCFMIDPQQVGFEIQGERFECQSPEQAFDQMKAKVLSDVEADLDAWEKELFPEPETEEPESAPEEEPQNEEEEDNGEEE